MCVFYEMPACPSQTVPEKVCNFYCFHWDASMLSHWTILD